MKKTLLIILSVLIVVALGYLAFTFGMRSREAPAPSPTDTNNPDLFPFGEGGEVGGGGAGSGGSGSGNNEEVEETGPIPRIRKISEEAVAGFGFGDQTEIFYAGRMKGNIFRAYTDQFGTARLTITTVPMAHRALFFGEEVVLQTLEGDEIKTVHGAFDQTIEESGELETVFLPTDTHMIASVGTSLLSLIKTSEGSQLILSRPNGMGATIVLETGISDWRAQDAQNGDILLTTKAAYEAVGYAFLLNRESGSLQQFLTGNGLETNISQDGKRIIASESSAPDSITTSLVTTADRSAQELSGIRTLAEKCVWSTDIPEVAYCAVPAQLPPAEYPDEWHQGAVSFADRIWRIDALRGSADLVFDMESQIGEAIDAVTLTLSPDEKYLLFVNKKDSILWSLRLEE